MGLIVLPGFEVVGLGGAEDEALDADHHLQEVGRGRIPRLDSLALPCSQQAHCMRGCAQSGVVGMSWWSLATITRLIVRGGRNVQQTFPVSYKF